ncbi:MAG TPA: DUF4136 domain-containing protein [Cyclobacteriaceae bacterium]|jgi:hypothetical protein|nr:DUF4136 domain-containing protein [Cyclobacteriaceae bacterium]
MKLTSYYSKLLVVGTLLLAACYPEGPEFADDPDVVVTHYNPEYAFKSKGTFAIPDKIVKITGNAITGDPPKYLSDAVGKPMLNQMVKNMTAFGYTQVPITAAPDLVLLPAAMETTTVVYWYDYWGWYYPGWGYPYYPYYPTYSSFTTGTLTMNLVDPKLSAADGNDIAQWTGALNGMLTYSYDAVRVNRLIDQAFTQSASYLKK